MSVPFALSLDKYVNHVGTDVGFASLLGVALLALLYFAGARESRTLRDQLEDAHERMAGLEARLSQAVRAQAARAAELVQSGATAGQPGRPGVVPAPSLSRGAPGRGGRPGVPAPSVLGAPAGCGAAALGSATTLIPAPAPAAPQPGPAAPLAQPAGPQPVASEPAAPEVPAVPAAPSPAQEPAPVVGVPTPASVPVPAVPAIAAAAASAGAAPPSVPARVGDPGSDTGEFEDDFAPEDTLYVPASTAAGANGRGTGNRGGASRGGANRGGGAAVAPPPMAFADDERSGPPPRRTIPTVPSGPSRGRVLAGRAVGVLAGIVVVAVIVVVLVSITSSGGSKQTSTPSARTRTTPRHHTTVTAFNPSTVKVSVINGTNTSGLAGAIATQLSGVGYSVPKAAVTNADVQTDTTSSVAYMPGYASAASHVAAALTKANNVAVTQITPATQADISSCGTPDTTGVAGTCPAKVIVIVGSDLAGAAGSSSSA